MMVNDMLDIFGSERGEEEEEEETRAAPPAPPLPEPAAPPTPAPAPAPDMLDIFDFDGDVSEGPGEGGEIVAAGSDIVEAHALADVGVARRRSFGAGRHGSPEERLLLSRHMVAAKRAKLMAKREMEQARGRNVKTKSDTWNTHASVLYNLRVACLPSGPY